MIHGIGTDVCDVRRIRATLERNGERFARKGAPEAASIFLSGVVLTHIPFVPTGRLDSSR